MFTKHTWLHVLLSGILATSLIAPDAVAQGNGKGKGRGRSASQSSQSSSGGSSSSSSSSGSSRQLSSGGSSSSSSSSGSGRVRAYSGSSSSGTSISRAIQSSQSAGSSSSGNSSRSRAIQSTQSGGSGSSVSSSLDRAARYQAQGGGSNSGSGDSQVRMYSGSRGQQQSGETSQRTAITQQNVTSSNQSGDSSSSNTSVRRSRGNAFSSGNVSDGGSSNSSSSSTVAGTRSSRQFTGPSNSSSNVSGGSKTMMSQGSGSRRGRGATSEQVQNFLNLPNDGGSNQANNSQGSNAGRSGRRGGIQNQLGTGDQSGNADISGSDSTGRRGYRGRPTVGDNAKSIATGDNTTGAGNQTGGTGANIISGRGRGRGNLDAGANPADTISADLGGGRRGGRGNRGSSGNDQQNVLDGQNANQIAGNNESQFGRGRGGRGRGNQFVNADQNDIEDARHSIGRGRGGQDGDHRDWSGKWGDNNRFDVADRIRNDWKHRRHDNNDFPFYGDWWGRHHRSHNHWAFWGNFYDNPYYWWSWTPAPRLGNWFVWGGWPQYYYWDYGPGEYIYCHNGVVYVNGRWFAPAPVYYQQTVVLAQSAPDLTPQQAVEVEWLPLGVFAVTRDGVVDPGQLVQLAVTADGIIGGTVVDQRTGVTYSVEGKVDKQTQRAVWTYVDGNGARIAMESSVFNLTQPESTGLIHYSPNDIQVIELVRLEQPADGAQTLENDLPLQPAR